MNSLFSQASAYYRFPLQFLERGFATAVKGGPSDGSEYGVASSLDDKRIAPQKPIAKPWGSLSSASLRAVSEPRGFGGLSRLVALPNHQRGFASSALIKEIRLERAYGQRWAAAFRKVMEGNQVNRLNPEESGYRFPVVLGDRGTLFELINVVGKRISNEVCTQLGIKAECDFAFGQGNFGTVKLARDMDTGIFYAIKRVNKFKIGAELQVQDHLPQHPNIVRAVDYALAPCREGWDNYHIFMPIAEHGDGARFIRKWNMLANELTDTVKQSILAHILHDILDGLEAMHNAGIAHLDIKPPNLLFRADGTVALCDYSTSLVLDGPVKQSNGTQEYMAPEQQFRPKRPYDAKQADLWMLGVTLLEMFDDQHPFDQPSTPIVKNPSQSCVRQLPHLLKHIEPEQRLSLQALRMAPCLLDTEQRRQGALSLKELMSTVC